MGRAPVNIAPLADRLAITTWPDQVVHRVVGYRHDDTYVETFWLPVIGPSAFVVYRRLAGWCDATGAELVLDTTGLPGMFGLADAPFQRALHRLAMFQIARPYTTADDVAGYEVRTWLSPVARRHSDRFPAALQADLEHWQRAERPT